MKIGILGAFSTGKTTLLNEMKKLDKFKDFYFDISLERKIAKKLNIDFNKSSEKEIEEYQKKLLEETIKIAKEKNKLVTDTPTHLGLCYVRNERLINEIIKSITNQKLYDILVYLPIEFEIYNDGIRHTDKNFQNEIDKKIRNILNNKKLIKNTKVIKLTGTVNERIEKLLKELKKIQD